jgi:hypothetical protein
MQSCSKSHPHCNASSAISFLPKRVIAVGCSDQFEDIRLEETTGQQAQYLALSHCWGTSRHLTTEKATLKERKSNISWSDFPKTFQDAIIVTRQLGFDYLWIDSLCIVQDSAEDWQEESAKMGEIYQRAHLVIAATQASDGDSGCFQKRKTSHFIQGLDMDNKPFSLYARETNTHNTHYWGLPANSILDAKDGIMNKMFNQATFLQNHYPLLTRSWCYQERLLATRVLHFEENEMVWECLTCVNCECGAMQDYRNDPVLKSRQLAAGFINDPKPTQQDEQEWRALVSSVYQSAISDLDYEEVQKLSESCDALRS